MIVLNGVSTRSAMNRVPSKDRLDGIQCLIATTLDGVNNGSRGTFTGFTYEVVIDGNVTGLELIDLLHGLGGPLCKFPGQECRPEYLFGYLASSTLERVVLHSESQKGRSEFEVIYTCSLVVETEWQSPIMEDRS